MLKTHLVLSVLLGFLAACPSQCGKQVAIPKATAGAPKPQHFDAFPTLDLTGLSGDQKQSFAQLANEETCPCACPMTLAGCLQKEGRCKPAHLFAEWVIERLTLGTPMEVMNERISQELSAYSLPSRLIESDGYAFKGNKNAPMVIVEFADFQCGHCKEGSKQLKLLAAKYPKEVKVVFKYYPLQSIHPIAKTAAIAAEAAAKQGKFWEMHDALFASQEQLSDELIRGHAKALGLNMKAFDAAMKAPSTLSKVEKSIDEGKVLQITGTPAIFFNGRAYHLSLELSGFELRLKMEKARQDASCS